MKMINLQHSQARRPNRCGSGKRETGFKSCGRGFTIIEILIVVMIIAIAAMIAVPMVGSADSMQIRSAANVIAADIEYAKSMAMSRQQPYRVAFDKANNCYQLEQWENLNWVPIEHPVRKGFQYIMNFGSSSQLNRISIVEADFGGASQISFSPTGSPSSGGLIKLQAGGIITTITIEAVTGFILISD